MFYFLSAISCGRMNGPLQKVLLNAKRACNAVMKGNAHFLNLPFLISISSFLVLPIPVPTWD